MGKEINLEYLRKEIYRLDPKLKENDTAFSTALILLSSLVVGTSIKKISKFTEVPLVFVKQVVRRLRKYDVFVGRQIAVADWFEKDKGGVAFWLDVCVGEGLVEKKLESK